MRLEPNEVSTELRSEARAPAPAPRSAKPARRPGPPGRNRVALAGSTAVLCYEGERFPPLDIRLGEALCALFPPGCGYAGVLRLGWRQGSSTWILAEALRTRDHYPPEDVTGLLGTILRERGLPITER